MNVVERSVVKSSHDIHQRVSPSLYPVSRGHDKRRRTPYKQLQTQLDCDVYCFPSSGTTQAREVAKAMAQYKNMCWTRNSLVRRRRRSWLVRGTLYYIFTIRGTSSSIGISQLIRGCNMRKRTSAGTVAATHSVGYNCCTRLLSARALAIVNVSAGSKFILDTISRANQPRLLHKLVTKAITASLASVEV